MGESYPIVGGPEAGYMFEFKPDGIYLTIYPNSAQTLMIELSDMHQILRGCGIMTYDIGMLAQIMKEADGQPHKISDPVELTEEDLDRLMSDVDLPAKDETPAKLIVEITRDRLKASIKYDTRSGSGLPTREQVLEALAAKRVKFGIDEDAIDEGIKSLNPFVAAEGIAAIPGENAYIDRKFDLGVKGRPVVDEYDRVDYKNLNLFVLAKKNETLAIRIPQKPGKPGMSVFGDKIPAPNGRPIPMPQGKNTQVVGEHQLIATINGQIVDSGNRISIDPRLEIKGNVGVGTGDIDFDGSVSITGSIKQGYSVKATGDVEIKGSVSGGEVSGRNVYISGGITGANRGKVHAELDIRCAFTENAVLEAGQDIYIADAALHSTLRAGKKIIVEDKRGQITGGMSVAGEEIRAKVIGNSAFVVTRVTVGVDPALQKEYNDVCKEYKDAKKKLAQITQILDTLGKIDVSRLPQERIDQLNSLTRSQFPLAGKIKRDEKKILEIEAQLAEMKNGKVRASECIYTGSRISINSVVKNVQKNYMRCTMYLEEGEVVIGPY